MTKPEIIWVCGITGDRYVRDMNPKHIHETKDISDTYECEDELKRFVSLDSLREKINSEIHDLVNREPSTQDPLYVSCALGLKALLQWLQPEGEKKL